MIDQQATYIKLMQDCAYIAALGRIAAHQKADRSNLPLQPPRATFSRYAESAAGSWASYVVRLVLRLVDDLDKHAWVESPVTIQQQYSDVVDIFSDYILDAKAGNYPL